MVIRTCSQWGESLCFVPKFTFDFAMETSRLSPPVTPIALRTSLSEEHPLAALKPAVSEAQGTARKYAGQLNDLLSSTMKLFDRVKEIEAEVMGSRTAKNRDELLGTAFDLLIEDIPQKLIKTKQFLRSHPVVTELEEFRMLVRELEKLPNPQDSSLKKRHVSLREKSATIQARFLSTGLEIAALARELSPQALPRVAKILEQFSKEDHRRPELFKDIRRFISDLTAMRGHDRRDYQVLKAMTNRLNSMSQLEKQFHPLEKELRGFEETVKQMFKDIVITVEEGSLMALVKECHDALKDRFVPVVTQKLLAPYLDPIGEPAQNEKFGMRLPRRLSHLVRDLGVSANGELITTGSEGNISKLVEGLATLIEAKDPVLLRQEHLNNRLAPVIRAGLVEARALLASRETQRELDRKENEKQTQIRQAEAAEMKLYVGLFFDGEFTTGLPTTTEENAKIRAQFLEQYPDLSGIVARQTKISSIAEHLGLPSQDLLTNWEFYLLSDKELDRWSKNVEQVRSRLQRQLEPNQLSFIYEPTNFIPSRLPETIRNFDINL